MRLSRGTHGHDTTSKLIMLHVLVTKDTGGAPRGNPVIKPAVTPVHQPKAVHLAVLSWGLNQTLLTPPLETSEMRANL